MFKTNDLQSNMIDKIPACQMRYVAKWWEEAILHGWNIACQNNNYFEKPETDVSDLWPFKIWDWLS